MYSAFVIGINNIPREHNFHDRRSMVNFINRVPAWEELRAYNPKDDLVASKLKGEITIIYERSF